MSVKRVLISGMGGELGTRVTNLLEARADVDEIHGVDLDPPRRRIPRSHFHRMDPRDRKRVGDLVADVDPTAVLHLGTFEPDARVPGPLAADLNAAFALNLLGAAARARSLQRIVVRSGIEVYGRRRGAPTRPDEGAPVDPTSGFGRSLAHLEEVATDAARAADVPCTLVRIAPVVGPHLPSPLGRYLRLPAVGFSPLSDLPFSLVHHEDAAAALVAALLLAGPGADGPVNVVGRGAVTTSQAIRIGGRLPVPLVGPVAWGLARGTAGLWGAPVPDHVLELILRGRCADGSRELELIGEQPRRSTTDVVRELYDWAEVVHLDVTRGAAA